MSNAKAFIRFDNISEFSTWDVAAAARMGAAPGVHYSTPIMRHTPADGSCVAKFVIAHGVGDGPYLTSAEIDPLGYFEAGPDQGE